jgi:hypothetical protein
VLLTRSPLIHQASLASPFDLHVLSTPPAFILSQDQTLHKRKMHTIIGKRRQQRVRTDQETIKTDYPFANPKGLDLIQRNPNDQKNDRRGYLAFDKCTLLSSQGSDAPTARSLDSARGATSLLPPHDTHPRCPLRALLRRRNPVELRGVGSPILDTEARSLKSI